MNKTIFFVSFLLIIATGYTQEIGLSEKYQMGSFPLVTQSNRSQIYVDAADYKVVHVAAKALQEDIRGLSGKTVDVFSSFSALSNYPVIIGTIGDSKLIDSLILSKKISVDRIRGKWEAFQIELIKQPFKNVKQALVITGSDRRGTAFGVFELSKRLGISPWKWWADVHPERHHSLYITGRKLVQGSPSVRYRGIFINDEDWGMQPWAAKNMDPDVKDICPNTYSKIFELLLRLKANYIWPAMHPCTKAFYYYKENPKLADDYAIVVGSSHCEPMLRNNVFEWAENFENEYGKKPGEWRYDLNQKEIYQYWADRVVASKKFESVYTVGMRGIHDGSMPGPRSMPEKVQLLQKIISDQRELLQTEFAKTSGDIPQIFCPYKEVLDVYRNGVQLPDDITIVWSDDNHGFIRQLSNEKEQQRSGGSGIYYHLSYWGSPQDYLWLSSMAPSLISYEMTKAFDHGADRLWVFNVGDIKPAEMEIEFAMELAWDIKKWKPESASAYAEHWAAETFGKEYAKEIAAIKQRYYQLAASGKPEHLGNLSFTETQTDERLKQYQAIAQAAEKLYATMPARLKDAYFELVYYPVLGAKLMNEKILYARKSLEKGIRVDLAKNYAAKAKEAYVQIGLLTDRYNHEVAQGKWNAMMNWHPRDQAVFQMPRVADQAYLDSVNAIQTKASSTASTELKKPVVLDAANYSMKKEFTGSSIKMIKGLGINGAGMALFPFTQTHTSDSSLRNISYLEYKINLTEGMHSVMIKCLPTQSVKGDHKLYYAISVNETKPVFVNIHAESESKEWKQNVLRGYAEGKTVHEINRTRESVIRIYFPETGLVINTIEID